MESPVGPVPSASVPPAASTASRLLKVILPIAYVGLAVIPGWIFFSHRGGLSFLEGVELKTGSTLLFPLAGLYAFLLVWGQVMLGSNMRWLRRISPRFESYHRKQGVFTLLFALFHPAMILFGYGAEIYFGRRFVAPSLMLFIWLGYFQLILMLTTVATAVLRKRVAWLRTRWRTIHYLNYIVLHLRLDPFVVFGVGRSNEQLEVCLAFLRGNGRGLRVRTVLRSEEEPPGCRPGSPLTVRDWMSGRFCRTMET